jgi:SNF2 family DNA or RNA helicase
MPKLLKSAISKRSATTLSGPTAKKTRFNTSKPHWKPHGIQRKGIKWLLENAAAGLLFDPGLGKTSTTLGAIKILDKTDMLVQVLIIAPLRVCYTVWPGELDKWDDFKGLTHAIVHGPKKKQALNSGAQILLINPEGLKWLFSQPEWKQMKLTIRLVVDESTKFKNTNTLRFKLLKAQLRYFVSRWILTGTPAPRGLLDLFGQMYIVDMGLSLGQYITHYRNAFFDPTGFGGYTWEPRHDSEAKIAKRIKPYLLRARAEDFIDLPDVLETNVVINLDEKARKLYTDMEDELFSVLDGKELSAANAAVASGKCRQITGGALYVHDEVKKLVKSDRYIEIHDEKLDALVDLLEQRQGKPTMVAYEFKHELERITKALAKAGFGKVPYIGGGVSAAAGDALARRWNDGDLPVLLVHPDSVSHGLNLQGCEGGDTLVFYTTTWDYEKYDQLVRRLRRQGSKSKKIFVIRLVAAATVDLIVLKSTNKKRGVQDSLLNTLQRYRSAA